MGNLHLVTGYAGQTHVTSADQGAYNAATIGSGEYVLDKGNKFAASIISNNQIRVLDGEILFQGRYVRLDADVYVDLTIENGAIGYYRNDLIVARYTKNSLTGVEEFNLVVLKGTAVTSDPADPEYTVGDLLTAHDLQADIPLYRVPLDGLNVQELVPLFTTTDISLFNLIGIADEHIANKTIHITAAERTKWNTKQNALTFDSIPRDNSTNPVTSGGVKTYVDNQIEAIYNIDCGTF